MTRVKLNIALHPATAKQLAELADSLHYSKTLVIQEALRALHDREFPMVKRIEAYTRQMAALGDDQ